MGRESHGGYANSSLKTSSLDNMKCVHHTTSKRKLMTLSVAIDYFLFDPRAYEVTT